MSRVEVSIVMPCLDEAGTLPGCITDARAALAVLSAEGLEGEIVVADNGSKDESVDLAERGGCRVVHCRERGYGYAVRRGVETSRGRFVVMGDADGSYDFGESVPMVRELVGGSDFCMGSRRGRIAAGAMPWMNRYFGNPLLTAVLNLRYRSGFRDAHCGLRAFTREAFDAMDLRSGGMELASEMVVRATILRLQGVEVPVSLRPDGRGRKPHLRPWRDGWRHLRLLLGP